ncbi:MAG: hypothetical protein LUG16_00330 [Candidatus Gastranaerophilales bacterium]|nr:hypothetical protein [Candidatus Gastranaerophilales bacterium]
MKKKLVSLVFCFVLTIFICNCAFAGQFSDYDGENVDKFVPQSGVRVRPSRLAEMMENGTKNMTQKGKNNSENSNRRSNTSSENRSSGTQNRTFQSEWT